MTARRETTKERAYGQWRYILPRIGIDAKPFLSGRNCPCPICRGTDRFRFLDRKGQDGDGMWVCNQCAPRPRPAIDLVIAFTSKPFRDAARLVDDILGGTSAISKPVETEKEKQSTDSTVQSKAQAVKIWRRSSPVRSGDAVDRYLHWRGVGMDVYPASLRTCALDWCRDDATGQTVRHPAMIAYVTNPDGWHVATHRTFLASDGHGKADVTPQRKTSGRHGPSPIIRLASPAHVMGIAEGIETALSAARLFGIPTWSVLSTYGIETFVPPAQCQSLIVFADHDKNGAGQRAAGHLVQRLRNRITVEIKLPDQPGDWNDVLMGRTR